MTDRRALSGPVAVVLIGSLLLAALLSTAAYANVANCSCPRVLGHDGKPLTVPPGKQPVLLVHGFGPGLLPIQLGHPGEWLGEGSLADRLTERSSEYVVGRFDYSGVHNTWVTEPDVLDGKSIAEQLANAMSCMAKLSGKKVILVGHSMGGLAAKAAITGNNSAASAHVAGFISLGTPWRGVPDLRLKLLHFALRSPVGVPGGLSGLPGADLLRRAAVDAVAGSAFDALTAGMEDTLSPQLEELQRAKIPLGIPVLPVAGVVGTQYVQTVNDHALPMADFGAGTQVDISTTTFTVLGQKRIVFVATGAAEGKASDALVAEKSAVAVPLTEQSQNLGPLTLRCPAETPQSTINQPVGEGNLVDVFAVDCLSRMYHSAMPADPQFADQVMPTIESWKQAAKRADPAVLARMDVETTCPQSPSGSIVRGRSGTSVPPPPLKPTPLKPAPPNGSDPLTVPDTSSSRGESAAPNQSDEDGDEGEGKTVFPGGPAERGGDETDGDTVFPGSPSEPTDGDSDGGEGEPYPGCPPETPRCYG